MHTHTHTNMTDWGEVRKTADAATLIVEVLFKDLVVVLIHMRQT